MAKAVLWGDGWRAKGAPVIEGNFGGIQDQDPDPEDDDPDQEGVQDLEGDQDLGDTLDRYLHNGTNPDQEAIVDLDEAIDKNSRLTVKVD